MTKTDALNFFGTQRNLANALGVGQSAVAQWTVIPEWRQFQLQHITRGRLKIDGGLLPPMIKGRVNRKKRAPKKRVAVAAVAGVE